MFKKIYNQGGNYRSQLLTIKIYRLLRPDYMILYLRPIHPHVLQCKTAQVLPFFLREANFLVPGYRQSLLRTPRRQNLPCFDLAHVKNRQNIPYSRLP